MLEALGKIPRSSRKLAYLWALEKMEKQGPLPIIHKAQALSVTGPQEGEMEASGNS